MTDAQRELLATLVGLDGNYGADQIADALAEAMEVELPSMEVGVDQMAAAQGLAAAKLVRLTPDGTYPEITLRVPDFDGRVIVQGEAGSYQVDYESDRDSVAFQVVLGRYVTAWGTWRPGEDPAIDPGDAQSYAAQVFGQAGCDALTYPIVQSLRFAWRRVLATKS